jgi:hypothetical protein
MTVDALREGEVERPRDKSRENVRLESLTYECANFLRQRAS